MLEKICDLLNLSIEAGLGRRLAQAQVKQDAQNPNLYIISQENVAETLMLAYALSVRAKEFVQTANLSFQANRIGAHSQPI